MSGRRASDIALFNNDVVTFSASWQGRVLILPVLPLKSPFFLSAPAIRLIVRDCHDKRLFVFLTFFFDRCSLSVVLFCSLFLLNMATFCISQKYSAAIQIFEKFFLERSDPLFLV